MPTFYDRFLECAQRWPNNVALELERHDHLESCTYRELHSCAQSVGRWITENKAGPGAFKPVPVKTDDIASLLYTSGTTADPKGVMLTHGNFLGEVDAVFNWVDIGPKDALLGVLPLFHVLALMANLLLPLVKGSRVVYLETLNTTELLRALTERNITAFAVVPQFFYLIHERVTQEIAKRGALTRRAFKAMLGINRILRKVGINAGPILFRKVHETLGP